MQIDKLRKSNNKILQADKPLVSILLAVYNPNENWLIEQLTSLNKQTYENLELCIYDDCPQWPVKESLFEKYITNFKYRIIRGKCNRGSNFAFEELTKLGDGEYFAYCDQDDIWEKDKISLIMNKFKEDDVTLVCCDLCIIDERGRKTHNSICDIRKRIVYKRGYDLANGLMMVNFVTGCAMIVKRDIALEAIPFLKEMIHDQWISIIAAVNGKIEFINKPLVRYRQHSSNQTGILKDVYDKESYYEKRIVDFIKRFEALNTRFNNNEKVSENIASCLTWLKAREEYSHKMNIKSLIIMIKYRKFHKISVFIECILPLIPNFIFKYIISLTKKGVL